ncbi:YceI family protein [Aquimarina sp. RZ0]|uniref:YceI family protein n=1 Tax=Aquimarina sp. RZ0 TaxID=2607730 RepID=UPI0011F20737|nr:YceI family protein [Aquimarina sp. RZ0]KAA1243539.1 YceI family protein [Aquimarina sp. RZ0]
MKTQILIFVLLLVSVMQSQEKKVTRVGEVTFESKTSIEDIYAKNSQAASIFLLHEKTVAFNVLLRSFKFDKALMQEHFNEKYVHSDKYPSAKFKGVIIDDIDLKSPKKHSDVELDGIMEFHGVTKPIKVTADIVVKSDQSIVFTSVFKLKLEDYKVAVPALMKDKISPEIVVNVRANYK